MSNELQNAEEFDSGEQLQDQEQASEDLNQGAELATASEEKREENSQENDFNQEAVNKVINQKHFEAKEAERKAQAYKEELEKYKSQANQSIVQEVPPIPDAFDDDYETKLAERDKIIQRNAEVNAQNMYAKQQQEAQQQAEIQRQQAELQKDIQTYAENAQKTGIETAELQEIGNTIAAYNVPVEVQMHILKQADGPLIAKYLASNPVEMQNLAGMGMMDAALHIERTVKAKAEGLKPRTSNTPPPATDLNAGRADPDLGQMKYASGGSFE